ncbi:uncharacterized protein LOC127735199 [Mytilus californianus]|uniref:uncharacterized protein LOC127735199 n=1 Tax=Mytilus californianus TaxID=6549 RepID=UPI0022475534|nr:uncharacterized protein LOC127735199 [Mytilus californianus]
MALELDLLNEEYSSIGNDIPSLQLSNKLSRSICSENLPSSVNNWSTKHAEFLNIYYEKEYVNDPLDVMGRIPTLQPFSREQNHFTDSLKSSLQFNASYKNFDETYNFHTIENGLKKELVDTICKLNKNPEQDRFIKFKVSRFLKCLHRFMNNMESLRMNYEEYKGNFKHLLGSFVEMCGLEVLECSDTCQSVWRNLQRTKAVVSKPDFRLYKSGLEDFLLLDDEVVVPVTEVKQSHEPLQSRSKEMNSTTNPACSDNQAKSQIELDFNEDILGQHAGTLLLDLDRYCLKKTVYIDEDYVMRIPGIMFKGTQVLFTLLEMNRSHHRKLRYSEDLDDEKDMAKIYYSRPLDILVEKDRCTLIESFMRLNNI